MKISKRKHVDPSWGYLELEGGSIVAMPKKAMKELQAENEKLKKEVADYHQLQWQHDALIDENEKLKGELEMERDDCSNAKKCEIEYHKAYDKELDENAKLRNENEQLKDSCSYQVYGNMCKEREKLLKENAELKDKVEMHDRENERLKKFVSKLQGKIDRQGSMIYYLERTNGFKHETIRDQYKFNRKLRCLTLHLMSEYCFAQGTIIHTKLELTEQSIEEDRKMIHKVNIRDRWGEYFAEAYRNAKKELKEESNGFFLGYVIGFLTALMLLYLIRREVEQVANGERVATNKPKALREGK